MKSEEEIKEIYEYLKEELRGRYYDPKISSWPKPGYITSTSQAMDLLEWILEE